MAAAQVCVKQIPDLSDTPAPKRRNYAAMGAMLERRTVANLRDAGFFAERVSRGGRFGGDLFGVVDIVAVDRTGIEMIQVTTREARSAHRRKIQAAALRWPVRLIYWFKCPKGRWTFLSEVVE